MNRALPIANFLGTCVIAALCVLQWHAIVRIDNDRDRLERIRNAQNHVIDQQSKTLADQSADLEDFRKRLMLAEDQSKDMQQKLTAARSEEDQLHAALAKWQSALIDRDAALQRASTQIQLLVKQRDAVTAQFNDLATKYNAIVKSAAEHP